MIGGAARFPGFPDFPHALVNARGVFTHHQNVHALDVLRLQVVGLGQFRRDLDGAELAIEIEGPAQVVHVASAAGTIQHGSAPLEDVTAEFNHFLRQHFLAPAFGITPDGRAVIDLEPEVRH